MSEAAIRMGAAVFSAILMFGAAAVPGAATAGTDQSGEPSASVACDVQSLASLTAAAKTLQPSLMIAGGQMFPGGGEGDLILIPRQSPSMPDPTSAAGANFFVFTSAPAKDPRQPKGETGNEEPISVQPLTIERAKQFNVTAPNVGGFVLHVGAPDEVHWLELWAHAPLLLWSPTSSPTAFTVFACSNHKVIAWASRTVPVSSSLSAKMEAGLLVLAAYLFAATVVYRARARATKDSQRTLAAPLRMEQVEAWSFWRCLDPVVLTSDAFDRGSLSKFQILIFAGCVCFEVAELNFQTGILSGLSSTIVYLLGIPAAGTLSVQLTAMTRDRLSADNWAWLVNMGVLPINDPGKEPPRWSDLIMTSDSELDLSKLQALIFTLIVAIAMVGSGVAAVAIFAVPATVLQILALSQVVFVGGGFARPTTLGDIDDLVTQARQRLADLRAAARSGVDITSDGKPGLGEAVSGAPFGAFAAARTNVPNATQRYVDIAEQIKILFESLSHRAVEPANLLAPSL